MTFSIEELVDAHISEELILENTLHVLDTELEYTFFGDITIGKTYGVYRIRRAYMVSYR